MFKTKKKVGRGGVWGFSVFAEVVTVENKPNIGVHDSPRLLTMHKIWLDTKVE